MEQVIIVSAATIQMAKFLGILMTIVGFTVAINAERFAKTSDASQSTVHLFGAVLFALIGSIVLSGHNQWAQNWTCVITIIGWLLIIGSVYRGWFTTSWVSSVKKMKRSGHQGFGIVVGLVGLFLLYQGWMG